MAEFRKFRKCDYSPLEDRRLLAVTASLDAGILTIFGDASANTVNVQQSGSFLDLSGDITQQYNFVDVSLIRFYGGSGNDFFENFTSIDTLAVGHAGDDTLRTADGTDNIYGGTGNDTLVSTGGDDRLFGNDGTDVLYGGIGNDTIYGLNGDDELHGEEGDDTLVAGIGDDIVYGGDGEDLVYGHLGNDTIHGGADLDRLFGQDDDDLIYGNDGNDTVRGGRGIDTLYGNAGNDRILGDEGGDTIYGGEGNETVFAGQGDDIIRGGDGNDLLFAGEGDDDVEGEGGNDILRGNDGNDSLKGGNNADRVAGDDGDDYIEGGLANDTVLGNAGADTIVADSNDRAIGGAGDDILQLSNLGSDTAVFSGNYANYVVTIDSDTLVVRDTTGADGQDLITGAETFEFADETRGAAAEVTQRVYVQPIVVSNDNGGETAVFFGDDEQLFDTKRRIDEIYLAAGIDIEWLDTNYIDSTFINQGEGTGTRPTSDLNTLVTQGDEAGVGSSDTLVLDMYFVNRVPGFQELTENSANGLAFIDFSGIAMHTGDNLVSSNSGRSVAARVAAHEIGHNLGLLHVNDSDNLMDDGSEINSSQVATVSDSQFSQPCTCPLCTGS